MRIRAAFPLVFLLAFYPSEAYVLKPLCSTTQLLVVTTSDWNAVEGKLQRFNRKYRGGPWEPVGEPFSVVAGSKKKKWGAGMISTDALHIRPDDPIKKEGDGKAPAGLFYLDMAFGYASENLAGSQMPYMKLTESVECVDDTASKFYNRVVDRAQVKPDWNSSEHMRRTDELYRWGIVVDHNGHHVPGKGSCIFLHIWRGPGQGTVGCTAMPREQLESIIGWLDPTSKPLLVQLPLPVYQSQRKKWKLPALPRSSNR